MKHIIKIVSILFFVLSVQYTLKAQQCETTIPPNEETYSISTLEQRKAVDMRKAASVVNNIPVQIHRIANSSGTNGLNDSDIQDALAILNQRFSPNNMVFYECNPTNIINDDTYETLYKGTQQITDLKNAYSLPNVINIFFAPYVFGSDGTTSICGYATYPSGAASGSDEVILKNSCVINGSTFAHEMGHYFYLFHTHEDFYGNENVTRTTSNSCYNCSTTGDRLCDTAADPKLDCSGSDANMNTSCNYFGGEADACNVPYTPPVNNIMSYACKSCRTIFTSQQLSKMLNSYIVDRAYLDGSVCNPLGCPDNENITTNYYNGDNIDIEVTNNITASNEIHIGANVVYDAANTVALLSGFEVLPGGDFQAYNDGCGGALLTAEGDNSNTDATLHHYSNLLTGQVTIKYNLLNNSAVTLVVTDLAGNHLSTLVNNETRAEGIHTAIFNGNDYPAGMYYYTIQAGNYVETQKMTLVK